MGELSWKYANRKNRRAMKNNVKHDSYLLVPPEFQDQYGEAIYDDCYNGYGRIGRYDVYELVAIWNRQWLPKETTVMKKPVLEDFEGLWNFNKEELRKSGLSDAEVEALDYEKRSRPYNRALSRYKRDLQMLEDFESGCSDGDMKAKYGDEYLREIGINIACYDEDNKDLKYPIKIVDELCGYDDVYASLGDPRQGW